MAESYPISAVDPRDSNHLFAATQDGVIVTTDGCITWKSINKGLGSLRVNTLSLDIQNPDTVYVGTDSGAYVSFDSGKHWAPINDGLLGGLVIYSIVVDEESNVYAATPLGIFELVDQ